MSNTIKVSLSNTGVQGASGQSTNFIMLPAGDVLSAYRMLYLDPETGEVFAADKDSIVEIWPRLLA